jgi:hypothetical protein
MTKREITQMVGSKVMYRGDDLEIVGVRKYREWMLVLSSGAILLPSEIR